jgi:predicted RNase H-like nuclease (RuvC/YqgF family)
VLFIPKEAQRSDRVDPPAGGNKTDKFLAVDYELLQHASTTVATTEQTAPQPGSGTSETSAQAAQAAEALAQREKDMAQREVEIQRLKDIVNKNVSEVENMRKELQSVQEQLSSQPTGQDSQKRKPAPQQR